MEEKYPLFKTESGELQYREAYNQLLAIWPVPYEQKMIETPFGTTHIIVSGNEDAPPMVMLHGNRLSSLSWISNIEALSQGHRVYCVDILGDFGLSRTKKPMTKKTDVVEWLSSVMDSLGIDQADFVGHSMGGWLTFHFATMAPSRVNRMVLLAPVSLLPVGLNFMLKIYPSVLFPTRKRIKKAWTWFLSKGNDLPELLWEHIFTAWLHCRSHLNVFPTTFKEEDMKSILAPTLLLVGDNEVIYPTPAKALGHAGNLIPNIQTEIIPNANHVLIYEQADIVNQKILNFLVV